MSNIIEIKDLPIYDLQSEFTDMLNSGNITWYNGIEDQICLNSTTDDPTNYHLGRGSLYWNWDGFQSGKDNDIEKISRPKKMLEESDFTELCEAFVGTLFEKVYRALEEKYVLGRVRIMQSKPKTCLTWHWDKQPRIHFVMKTQPGCYMVFENEVKHLPNMSWWWTNTLEYHTAFNGSRETRTHLVATILDVK